MPPSSTYRPDPRHASLGGAFFDVVEPARFPMLTLRHRNQRWAARVGLDTLTVDEWQAAFARFEPLPDNLPAPLALRYHGHQFGVYNPALGDGRGFLFAQLRDADDRLLDLATKGSGTTPYSRGGDGKLTLKGGVRELLATELLEALGVPTSKTFSLFETGESLQRNDEPSPTRASVLVRLGHSHIRFGSFQRHAYREDWTSQRALVAYSVAHYAPELCHLDEHAPRALVQLVTERSARLCAAWMAAGFVHGVLNTDNLNITGESFDYGPFRFLPTLDPNFTAAYFDHGGRYAFGRQPAAVRWSCEQLAAALAPITPGGEVRVAAQFEAAFETALDRAIVRRLGVRSRGALADRVLRTSVWQFLTDSQIGFEQFFFDWYGGGPATPRATDIRYHGADFVDHLATYAARDPARQAHPYFARTAPCTLLIGEVEMIWEMIAARDDWSLLDRKLAQIAELADAVRM